MRSGRRLDGAGSFRKPLGQRKVLQICQRETQIHQGAIPHEVCCLAAQYIDIFIDIGGPRLGTNMIMHKNHLLFNVQLYVLLTTTHRGLFFRSINIWSGTPCHSTARSRTIRHNRLSLERFLRRIIATNGHMFLQIPEINGNSLKFITLKLLIKKI
jgi:hypothetical protein